MDKNNPTVLRNTVGFFGDNGVFYSAFKGFEISQWPAMLSTT